MDQESVVWRAPGAPAVRFNRRVMEGIAAEIREAHARGREAGGILVGRREKAETIIEDFEPAPCDYRSGPTYQLSENDAGGLVETLEWFGPRVLGFYCGHLGEGFAFDARKRDLLERHFPGAESLFLLLKPVRAGMIGDFFLRRASGLRPAYHPVPFPFEAKPEPQAPVRLELPPRPESPPRRSHTLPWAAVGLLLATAAAAVLGYRSVRPAAPPAPVSLAASHTPAPAAAQATPPPPVGEAERRTPEPSPAASDDDQIRAVLGRWGDAQLRGDSQALAACYTRRARRVSLSRRDRFTVMRLDHVRVTRTGSRRANVTFLKHWQTGGSRPFAGEQEERLAFVKGEDGWRIDSGEELRVLWTRRP
jgi:hypothetical protein